MHLRIDFFLSPFVQDLSKTCFNLDHHLKDMLKLSSAQIAKILLKLSKLESQAFAVMMTMLSCLQGGVCLFLEVKVVAERSPIQTAAILICLTGKRGDNLPVQPYTQGGGGGKRGRKQGGRDQKGRRAEQNYDKGPDRESQKKKARERERKVERRL